MADKKKTNQPEKPKTFGAPVRPRIEEKPKPKPVRTIPTVAIEKIPVDGLLDFEGQVWRVMSIGDDTVKIVFSPFMLGSSERYSEWNTQRDLPFGTRVISR